MSAISSEVDRRIAEHRAALAVEVAGDDVERVEQEGDQRAEAAEAGAGAPVDGGAVGGGEVAGQRAHGASAGTPLRASVASGGKLARRAGAARRRRSPGARSRPGPRAPRRRSPASIESSSQASASGSIGDVLERARGLGAARVDDDDAAAAVDDRVQLLPDPRRAEHAAVRDERVGADHRAGSRCARGRGSGR